MILRTAVVLIGAIGPGRVGAPLPRVGTGLLAAVVRASEALTLCEIVALDGATMFLERPGE
jgi:hypothetical protein